MIHCNVNIVHSILIHRHIIDYVMI